MPTADVNNITINYEISGPEDGTWLVLINGLADSLESWAAQVPAFTKAGYRVLTYDNRGIGKTSRPKGPYTSELLAADLHALLSHLQIKDFHLLGVSMGGMIAQSYALQYPNGSQEAGECKLQSLSLCCTYAQPSTFCERMFDLWADMAQRMSVQDVMRDVTLWAFTMPFFRTRTKELEEVEAAMKDLDMPLEAYLSQLNVIQKFHSHPTLEALGKADMPIGGLEGPSIMVLAGEEDILIPVSLSKEIHEVVTGSVWKTTPGGHGCMVSSRADTKILSEMPMLTTPAVGIPRRVQPGCPRFPALADISVGTARRANIDTRVTPSMQIVYIFLVYHMLHHANSPAGKPLMLAQEDSTLTTWPRPSASHR